MKTRGPGLGRQQRDQFVFVRSQPQFGAPDLDPEDKLATSLDNAYAGNAGDDDIRAITRR